MSCIIGAAHAQYHLKIGNYNHINGIIDGGNTAILGGAGPMGFGAISYFINGPRKPKLLVVTDVDDDRLKRAKTYFSEEHSQKRGVRLVYINPDKENVVERVRELTNNKMMNDVFVFASVKSIIEQGQKLLGIEGTLNFFAGPPDSDFSANLNFYDVHYNYHKVVGTSGGNTDDMKEALKLMSDGLIDPSFMISHIGGLNAGVETILNLPSIPGGKKLLYTHISMPLTAISDFEELSGQEGPLRELYKGLAKIVKQNNNIWCTEAEQYLMKNATQLKL
jgi:threonine dehydrogenase-like Zn-dependent dehydrogenase